MKNISIFILKAEKSPASAFVSKKIVVGVTEVPSGALKC